MTEHHIKSPPEPSTPSVKLDLERYLEPLSDWDAPLETKLEFLQTLHAILTGFVDLGFGLHPHQQTSETCGKVIDLNAALEAAMLRSDAAVAASTTPQASPEQEGAAK